MKKKLSVVIDLSTLPSTMIITPHFFQIHLFRATLYSFHFQMLPHLFLSTFLLEDSLISTTLKWYLSRKSVCVYQSWLLQEYKFQITLRQMWNDPRLEFKEKLGSRSGGGISDTVRDQNSVLNLLQIRSSI